MSGRMNALAQWFLQEIDISTDERPVNEEMRLGILNNLYLATAVAPSGQTVFVRTPDGRAALDCQDNMVWVDYLPNHSWSRYRFWMNASSLSDLGDTLRSKPRTTVESVMLTS